MAGLEITNTITKYMGKKPQKKRNERRPSLFPLYLKLISPAAKHTSMPYSVDLKYPQKSNINRNKYSYIHAKYTGWKP